jgi:hypothetical protein
VPAATFFGAGPESRRAGHAGRATGAVPTTPAAAAAAPPATSGANLSTQLEVNGVDPGYRSDPGPWGVPDPPRNPDPPRCAAGDGTSRDSSGTVMPGGSR